MTDVTSNSKTGYAVNYTEANDTMFSRQGYWGSTFTGKRIYLDEPRPEDFCIEDIAHGLSNVCRYGGQCVSFYSVAEHSYRGAKNIERFAKMDGEASLTALHDAYEFLLHDAAEAYVGDQIRPVVMYLDSYREMRDKMQTVINKKFKIPTHMSKTCKEMDERMLSTESRVMFGHDDKWWESPEFAEPIRDEWIRTRDQTIIDREDGRDAPMVKRPMSMTFMPPSQIKRLYLSYFYELHAALSPYDMVPDLPL
jgi:5'-deoxynucleotidase YfbR-like HD superfamily hydrolase